VQVNDTILTTLSLNLKEEYDCIPLTYNGKLFHSVLPLNLILLFPILD